MHKRTCTHMCAQVEFKIVERDVLIVPNETSAELTARDQAQMLTQLLIAGHRPTHKHAHANNANTNTLHAHIDSPLAHTRVHVRQTHAIVLPSHQVLTGAELEDLLS